MASWRETGLDSLAAARKLLDAGHARSAVSRAYYGAYAVVTHELVTIGMTFPYGWNNPTHDQLPDLVLHNMPLPRSRRYEINKALRRLRKGREDADYRPATTLTTTDARAFVRDAALVVHALGDEA